MNQVMYQNRTRQVVVKRKTVGIAYLVFFLTSMVGFHMFYLGRPGMAVAKILTANFMLVGMLVDLVMMPKYVAQANAMNGNP